MRIALITGSRSDRNALVMVESALKEAGHEAKLEEYVAKYLRGDLLPVTASSKAMELTSFLDIGEGWESGKHFADLVFVHGDRHEVLGIAFACNVMGIPIAHIGGGDVTEGSQDDCFRHAITKLSHVHFASNHGSADRIIQMGEEPDRVHATGDPGIDMVMATPTFGREETLRSIGLDSSLEKVILVLLHPDTL